MPVPDRPARRITISGSGDILIHPSLSARAAAEGDADGPSFVQELAGVSRRIHDADYAICHVEQTFNDPNSPGTEYPNYYTHPNMAKAIAATGFDACSTASNWTFLKGLDGIGRTNAALRRAGVLPAGSVAKRNEADQIDIEEVKGVKVAHLSFTDPADSPAVQGAPWAVNRATPDEIVAAAQAARDAGAEVVVVSLAMGQMGPTTTNATQRATVRTIAKSGTTDLIIGHGSHTIQGAQKIGNTWVVWHGNLLTSFFPDQVRMHEGLVSEATLTEQSDGRFAVSKIRGDVVLSLPQSGRLQDISAADCSSVPAHWQQAYAATRATLTPAIQQGFVLDKPCSGR